MAFSEFELQKYQFLMDDYLKEKRPPEHIREELDYSYRIEGQSIYISEIRPDFMDPDEKMVLDQAKTTYVRTTNTWKIFWMRQDLKWHGYEPDPEVDSLEEFLKVVKRDEYCCFWG